MDEAQQHKEIQKGFNAGYLMEKHNPALAQKLREGLTSKDNPYAMGFIKGSQEYAQEALFDNQEDSIEDDSISQEIDNPESNLEKDNNDKGLDIDA